MTDLVSCLSTGKGTWSPVLKLINTGEFENVYLVTNEFGEENFEGPDNCHLIVLDNDMTTENMRDYIKEELEGEVEAAEVALNMTSGRGKEHMALLSALLGLGLGIRQVIPTEEGFDVL